VDFYYEKVTIFGVVELRVYFCVPNLAAISSGAIGTGAPEVPNVNKFAVFGYLST